MNLFVFARLHARPGQRDAVQQAMFDIQGPTRREPGCQEPARYQSCSASVTPNG